MGYYLKFIDTAGQYRFSLRASNGEIILYSEMYSSNQARETGKASVKVNGSTTDIR